MEPEQPVADPAAEPEEENEEDEEEEETEAPDPEQEAAEDALLDRAQALISRVVEQETNPNPRLIHTLATIAEDQEARHLQECASDPSFNNTNTRGSHTIGKLANLIRENDDAPPSVPRPREAPPPPGEEDDGAMELLPHNHAVVEELCLRHRIWTPTRQQP